MLHFRPLEGLPPLCFSVPDFLHILFALCALLCIQHFLRKEYVGNVHK